VVGYFRRSNNPKKGHFVMRQRRDRALAYRPVLWKMCLYVQEKDEVLFANKSRKIVWQWQTEVQYRSEIPWM